MLIGRHPPRSIASMAGGLALYLFAALVVGFIAGGFGVYVVEPLMWLLER